MTRTVVVIAPHPDDELLGCGGTLLRHVDDGDAVHWVVVTAMTADAGFAAERIAARRSELDEVERAVGFAGRHELGFPTTRLDTVPAGELVGALADVVGTVEPAVVYVPSRSDVHTDHRIVHDAAIACTKWFRHPSVLEVYAYETLSETDAAPITVPQFQPTHFVDITAQIGRKLDVLSTYRSELGDFPFPRSVEAVEALARVRGAASGFEAAEAFQVVRQRR